eukprot:752734-Hanusia_phi.AAC.3
MKGVIGRGDQTVAFALLGFSVLNIFVLQGMHRQVTDLEVGIDIYSRQKDELCVGRGARKQQLKRMEKQIIRHGKFMLNLNDIYIGASLLFYGEWSDEEIDLMKLNLPVDGVVVDVGGAKFNSTLILYLPSLLLLSSLPPLSSPLLLFPRFPSPLLPPPVLSPVLSSLPSPPPSSPLPSRSHFFKSLLTSNPLSQHWRHDHSLGQVRHQGDVI